MYTWTFEQIEGKSDRKTLELKGWSAPFGRQRKDPIFTEVLTSRTQTTYFPGKNGSPTRHSFGVNHEPIELKGRWMTPQLLTDSDVIDANQQAENWKKFFADQRQCRMSWGNILSYIVFIDELHLARESHHQIAWKMKLHIDKDDAVYFGPQPPPLINITSFDAELTKFLTDSNAFKLPAIPDLNLDFLDQLDLLAGAINEPSARLNKLLGQVSDFESATFSTLQDFRSAVSGFEAAVVEFQDFLLSTTIDGAVLVRNAQSDLAWVKFQLDFDDQATGILGILAQADRAAQLASKSELGRFTTARDGDTWDSISQRATGGIDHSANIRALNGARYGEQPQAGEIYLVP